MKVWGLGIFLLFYVSNRQTFKMEGHHIVNLREYCRCCAQKFTEGISRKKRKGQLKLRPTVQNFMFGNDREGVEPEHLCQTKVWGSSSAWISDDTLMLMGGSLPPPGHGERSIFMYSSKPMDILTCGLEDSCKVDENFKGNTRLIECDVCGKDIHFYCDKKISKLKKTPEFYKCPLCNKKEKERPTKKRKRGTK